ncbi:MAG: bacillithiol system redox-active protein YtxJ [Acidobacteriota bacterium]
MASYTKLESQEALDSVLDRSSGTVVVFKHSLTCPVSSAALREFDAYLSADAATADYYLIEVQRQRDLSREVAQRTGVKHESPQALVMRDGEVAWNASHWHITQQSLTEALSEEAA